MNKETEFFIYLLEKYSEYKNISTTDVLYSLDDLGLTDFIQNMYERYHCEAIENAFKDIDDLIEEKKQENNQWLRLIIFAILNVIKE